MKLTENFELEEFKCHCGCEIPSSLIPNLQKLANNLQKLRDAIGQPLAIVSGYRCEKHNKAVGGAAKSEHMNGKAADIKGRTLGVDLLYTITDQLINSKKIKDGGLGKYTGWVHYDIGKSRRWHG